MTQSEESDMCSVLNDSNSEADKIDIGNAANMETCSSESVKIKSEPKEESKFSIERLAYSSESAEIQSQPEKDDSYSSKKLTHSSESAEIKSESEEESEFPAFAQNWLSVELKEDYSRVSASLAGNNQMTINREKNQSDLELSEIDDFEDNIESNPRLCTLKDSSSVQKEEFLGNMSIKNYENSSNLTITAEVVSNKNEFNENPFEKLSNPSFRSRAEDDELYVCEICEKVCISPTRLKDHIRVHSDERPYTCGICLKTFARNQYLRRHILTHKKEKRHTCKACAKAFLRLSDLRRHVMTHTNEKPYRCDICAKTFTQSSSLKRHNVIHTNGRPFTCEFCAKTFRSSSGIRRHITHFSCREQRLRMTLNLEN